MRIILAIACSTAIVAAAALPARAQAVQTPQSGPNSPALACGDYKKNSDGSWSPTKEVSIMFPDGTTLGVKAGTVFLANGTYMGLPMSLLLTTQCSK